MCLATFWHIDRAEWDGSCSSPFRGVELGCDHVLGSRRILRIPHDRAKHVVCDTPHLAGERAELHGWVGGIGRDLICMLLRRWMREAWRARTRGLPARGFPNGGSIITIHNEAVLSHALGGPAF